MDKTFGITSTELALINRGAWLDFDVPPTQADRGENKGQTNANEVVEVV